MIQTKHLILSKIDEKYSDELFKIWTEYDVIKYTYMRRIETVEQSRKRIKMLVDHLDSEVVNNFAIILDGKAIGCAGFPIRRTDKIECGFYYHIGKEYWNNGFTSEVADAMLKYLFEHLPNAIVRADSVVDNIASIKILEKIGFEKSRIEKEGFINNGLRKDLVHFKKILRIK